VVDHASKKSVAVSRVFFGVQNVLMPELVKVITPTSVQPRYQHESRFGLKKSQKTNIFKLRSIDSLLSPSMFFDHCVAHRSKVEFGRLFF